MFGTTKQSGISFIEIIVVLLIIALIGAVVSPLLQPRIPLERQREFITTLNRLTFQAWQGAVMTGKLHRVLFDLKKEKIIIQKLNDDATDIKAAQSYSAADHLYGTNEYQIPEEFKIVQFSVDGVVETGGGKPLETIWYYAAPDGTLQDVTLTIAQAIDPENPVAFRMTLNPFTAQFLIDELPKTA